MPEGKTGEERTFTVTIDDVEKTVSVPEGWATSEEIDADYMPKTAFKTELDRRVKSLTKGLVKRETLIEDEEFLTEFLGKNKDRAFELLGVDPKKPPELDIKELRGKMEKEITEQIHESEIKPREERLGKLTTRLEQMTERDFRASFTRAALGTGLHEDQYDPVASFYRSQFGYDPEHDEWFKLSAESSEEDVRYDVNTNPDEGAPPYKTIEHLLSEVRRTGKKKTWWRSDIREGGDFKGPGGKSTSVSYDDFRKMTPADRSKLRTENRELYDAYMKRRENEGLKKFDATPT